MTKKQNELHWQSKRQCMAICQSILHDSGWLTHVYKCVHLHYTPQPEPNPDERPCRGCRDLNHLEVEKWSDLLSDILIQYSAEKKILEEPCLATDSS